MQRKKFTIKLRKYGCHPETCNHDDHYIYYLWHNKERVWYKGFSSKEKAIAYCKEHRHSYDIEEQYGRYYGSGWSP